MFRRVYQKLLKYCCPASSRNWMDQTHPPLQPHPTGLWCPLTQSHFSHLSRNRPSYQFQQVTTVAPQSGQRLECPSPLTPHARTHTDKRILERPRRPRPCCGIFIPAVRIWYRRRGERVGGRAERRRWRVFRTRSRPTFFPFTASPRITGMRWKDLGNRAAASESVSMEPLFWRDEGRRKSALGEQKNKRRAFRRMQGFERFQKN